MTTRALTPTLLLALALVAAGCGGDGEEATATATTTPAAAATTPEEAPTTEAAATPTPTPTEEPATGSLEPATEAPADAATEAPAAAPGDVVAGTAGMVGDTLAYEGEDFSLTYTITEVVDPATDVVAANNYEVPEGQRYVFVRGAFTWVAGDYANAFVYPDIGAALVDDRGNAFPGVIAVVDECPFFEDDSVAVGQTIEGCMIYEISEQTPISAFQWSPSPSAEPLTWAIG